MSPAWRARYEELRAGALGEPVSPDARRGLTLLLRRGLWAWAQAVAVEPAAVRASSPVVLAPVEQPGALARLLAELARARRDS